MTFKALLATKTGDAISTSLVDFNEEDLMPGNVTVAVEYSTVNYKDAMAVTGRGPVIRLFPLIPGIDFAGIVEGSTYPGIAVGDRVVANGWGLSQTHHGGFARKARVSGEWLVKIPEAFSTKDAMAIGTAGYTAMLSVLALEHGGLTPEHGDILVTGANGGAGSVAIALLADLGYRVIASTGRPEEADYLRSLGAAEIIDRRTLSEAGAPITKERWLAPLIPSVAIRWPTCWRKPGIAAWSRLSGWHRRGPARVGPSLHPAQRHPRRHRFGQRAAGYPAAGVVTAGARPGPGQARPHHAGSWPGRGARNLGADTGRESPGAHRRRCERMTVGSPWRQALSLLSKKSRPTAMINSNKHLGSDTTYANTANRSINVGGTPFAYRDLGPAVECL